MKNAAAADAADAAGPLCGGSTVDSDKPVIGTLELGHSLVRSLVRSHRSLIRLLRTARFTRALRCAHSFPSSWDNVVFDVPKSGGSEP